MNQFYKIIFFVYCSLIINVAAFSQGRYDLNTELMKSTYKIQGEGSQGTAFFLGKPLKNDSSKLSVVLVTADHVLKGMKGDSATIFFRKKNKDDSFTKISFKFKIRDNGKPVWVKHDSVDIAALYVPIPQYVDIDLLGISLLGSDSIYKDIDIHPGDVFMCLGYPLGQESSSYGFPILRSGMLASYPIIPSKNIKNFLLDLQIFKGNSGGPVYFVQSGRTYRGSFHAETTQFIAGLVSKERINLSKISTPYKESTESQQLGLAVVIPAVFIKETIEKLP